MQRSGIWQGASILNVNTRCRTSNQYWKWIANTYNTHTWLHKKDGNKGDNDNEVEEYVVSHILRHVQRPEGMHFVVHRYGYGLYDDTVESKAHIPQHVIDWCWRRKHKHRESPPKFLRDTQKKMKQEVIGRHQRVHYATNTDKNWTLEPMEFKVVDQKLRLTTEDDIRRRHPELQ